MLPRGSGTAVGGEAMNPATLRLGAIALLSGLALQVAIEVAGLHPGHADPNDSVAAFQEYARASGWVATHLAQFAGALLVAIGLVNVARWLATQGGWSGALAVVGGVGAVMTATIFAVQMAVDGVALLAAVRAWDAATDPVARTAAFQVAESVRAIEKGLSGWFHLSNGLALFALGLATALGDRLPRWLGWAGAAAGAGFVAGGVSTAHTGFSAQAGSILLLPLVLGVVFVSGIATSMWRRSRA
jgi:hypothetical protein